MPRVAEGRTKAKGCCESFSIRVLSPRIDPPVDLEDGSIAYRPSFSQMLTSTASFSPKPQICMPSLSMSEDFPAPGDPQNPTRIDLSCCILVLFARS